MITPIEMKSFLPERENSDDDYDDTDEETEPVASNKEKSQKSEPVQRSGLQPEQPAVDSSRTDDSKVSCQVWWIV